MEISLRMIRGISDDAIQNAMELMQILRFLHHDGILEIFHQAWTDLWHRD
jgi:hypothetical protein